MPVERARHRLQLLLTRLCDRRPEDGAMAEVDAVEGAERDSAGDPLRPEGLESPDSPHAGCERA